MQMRQIILLAIFCFAVFTALSTYAQNQPVQATSLQVSAAYPMDQAGIFIQDAKWMLVANQNPVQTKARRGFAASLSYGIVPAKLVAEYEGEHSPTRVDAARPILCICHILSLPGDPVLVRLHPKKGLRELDGGKMIVYPVVGGSKMLDASKSDLVPTDVSQPESNVWLVRPQAPLEPGEYALMLGTGNASIYAFSVAPDSAHMSDTK